MFAQNAFNLPFLLVGLFTTCLYIIYDTQVIIDQAENGIKDVPTHTMILFIDLFDLFIKILQILIKLSDDNKKKKWRTIHKSDRNNTFPLVIDINNSVLMINNFPNNI